MLASSSRTERTTAATVAVLLAAAAVSAQSAFNSTSNSTSEYVSSRAAVATASSNFTLPSGAATASWPDGLVLPSSVPYSIPHMDLDALGLPSSLKNYHLANETLATRQTICDRQTKWCDTAGCAEADASINENFCDRDTMATRCTCSKGASLLPQYAWPVQVADCQNRASACSQACWDRSLSTSERNSCISNCSNNLRSTCSTPGQVSANYAVSKRGDKPSYALIQGGSANAAAHVGLPNAAVVMVAVSLVARMAIFGIF